MTYKSFMKYLLFLTVVSICLAAYNPPIASELIWMSAVAYESVDSINAWNCSECKRFSVSDVSPSSMLGQSLH